MVTNPVPADLLSSYFSLQVIYARRKYSVPPPSTTGPPEFERVFRAQANCSEYFPIFIIILWVTGVFFSQGVASFCGILYLYGRLMYFRGYSESAHGRLAPLYFSAKILWMLIGLSALGVLNSMGQVYLGLDVLQQLSGPLRLIQNAATHLGWSKISITVPTPAWSGVALQNVTYIAPPGLPAPDKLQKKPGMSILKAIWNRLGDSFPDRGSGFRSILPFWGTSYISRFILDYNSRMAALGLEGPPTLTLAGHSFTFLEGRWVSSSPGEGSKSRSRLRRLRQKKQALEEENNALKLRLEVLMDMLTEVTAQLEGQRQEGRTGKRPLPKKVTMVTQQPCHARH
ncbi:hypothetical protein SKAU_G00368570 [Synaphobranchus kaupii]|uniref:Leukotriene C4 synthase n=1 Tax=Synaphobranchus kaupii TaxID=118154 RepID=A0A9Q1IFR2_SYNKA|nr:hypothetical protein SKAU_G00368570 [Synaphobranchus kaupii]